MKKVFLSRRTLAFILLLIIGASLIFYFLYPPQPPQQPSYYSYSVKVYDAFSVKLNTPVKDVIVVLEGITNKEYNSSLKSPNLQNTTYQFSNLTAGDYLLKIYSAYNILLYNKTIFINENKEENIIIEAQPLTVYVNIDGSPSKFTYEVIAENLMKNFVLNGTIGPYSNHTFTELPLGEYSLSLKYLGLEISKVTLRLDGSTNSFTFNTSVVNSTFMLLDFKGKVLNETRLYLEHAGKTIGPFISSSEGIINATNLPPLTFNVIFEYKGINVTVKENPSIDLSISENKTFKFTTDLANLTLYVKYDDGKPASGLNASLSPLIIAKLGVNGNYTFNEIPANVKLKLVIENNTFVILQKDILIEPNLNNTIELTIPKYTLSISLKGKGDISSFKIFFVIQNDFNQSFVMRIDANKLELQLHPSIYRVYAYVYSPSNIPVLIYNEKIGLNKTIGKEVDAALGFSLAVSTSYSSDEIRLYYVDSTGEQLIAKKQGSSAIFTDLMAGRYKVAVFREDEFIASKLILVNADSPQSIQINIDTTVPNTLLRDFAHGITLILILLSLIVLVSSLIYRGYKRRREKK